MFGLGGGEPDGGVKGVPEGLPPPQPHSSTSAKNRCELPNNLSFMVGLRSAESGCIACCNTKRATLVPRMLPSRHEVRKWMPAKTRASFPNTRTSPLVLPLESLPLFRGNRARQHAEQEEFFASVEDDEVVGFSTVFIEERPSTIRIDRVASVCRVIGPRSDFTVAASGCADEASHPIFVKSDANLGDRATHVIVKPRPAEGIGPVEAGNATVLPLEPLPLFRGNGVWRHAEHEEFFASVKDDEVVGSSCTVCIEKRPGAIRIDL